MLKLFRIAVLPLVLGVAACGSTQMAMPYAPTTSPARIARPVVAMAPLVVNQRQSGREDPNWLGTIRGGYGNPVRELRVEEPIDRVVRRACADALTTRGLAAGGSRPRYTLSVTIHQFDANQYVRREATADFSAVLTEAATGREVWRDRERAYNVDGSLLSLDTGVFASTEDLRRVAVQTMNQAIDRLLDKPAFLAAVQR